MARDRGRMDLKKDIRKALEPLVLDDFQMDVVLAAVLPHFKLAYQRGVMAERSQAGYKVPNQRKESK